jgi:hypothetical protein
MDILLDDPQRVATDGRLAFMSALWFFMYPQSPKPSMHDAILGLFETNSIDDNNGICTGCFGTTTNIINGGLECGFDSSKARKRINYFDDYCDIFGADCPQEGKSCASQSNWFSQEGGGAKNMWLIKNENQPNACMVTPWVSGYSVYVTNDYKRCVCDAWDPTNPDCLVVDTDCDSEDDSSNQ